MLKFSISFWFLVVFVFNSHAQKVGVVFSGGGAHGLAHLGVLKALEENNIPVDYVAGTSMGGIIAAMYAAGYSPTEIEYVALSKDFQEWVNGRFDSDYKFFFKKADDNPSFITAKAALDSTLSIRLRANIVNDIPLNFALLELLAQPSANAYNNFDSLFVPFFCVVADVLSQEPLLLREGLLSEAVRGTLTVPFLYRPIRIDGKYVFDGGLYNNFPAKEMREIFSPDIIIGSNVSGKVFNEYPTDLDDKLLNRLLVYMFLAKSDSTQLGANGIYINPKIEGINVTNFEQVAELIKFGYDATMAQMDDIKSRVSERVAKTILTEKRKKFVSSQPRLLFDEIRITGANPKQTRYIERVFRQKNEVFNMSDVKRGYYKLVADDNFETVYPRILFNEERNKYIFELEVKPEQYFKVSFGGNVSTRPISNAFLGVQYNYVNRVSSTYNASFYSGRFYESLQLQYRADFSFRLPIYTEFNYTFNHWDYFRSSEIFIEDLVPTFVDQRDRKLDASIGIPLRRNGKTSISVGFVNASDRYSQETTFISGDTLDVTKLNLLKFEWNLQKNTLNKKQYPTEGNLFSVSVGYISGRESYEPGSTAINKFSQSNNREWVWAKFKNEGYFKTVRGLNLGYLIEANLSTQPLFSTYRASIVAAPTFYPLHDSKSLFLENFRTTQYAAAGFKNIVTFNKNFELRLEGYFFQPIKVIKRNDDQTAVFISGINKQRLAATANLVYSSPLGPVSLSANYYDDPKKNFGVLLHVGFLLYNKRALE